MELIGTTRVAEPGIQDSDKHTAYIDLSNKCRKFYHARIRAAEAVKQRLHFNNDDRNRSTRKKNSVDTAMETLRTEMASLMDQDLSLMRQLLLLNETIEELKSQHQYNYSHRYMCQSSCDINESDWSLSETDMYDSENGDSQKSFSPAVYSRIITRDVSGENHVELHDNFLHSKSFSDKNNPLEKKYLCSHGDERKLTQKGYFVCCNLTDCYMHEEQNSLDSGIYEPVQSKEVVV